MIWNDDTEKTTGISREKEIGMLKITYVEIVRCKNCKYWSAERINNFNKCRRWINLGVKNFATNGEWFCADGERRTDDA